MELGAWIGIAVFLIFVLGTTLGGNGKAVNKHAPAQGVVVLGQQKTLRRKPSLLRGLALGIVAICLVLILTCIVLFTYFMIVKPPADYNPSEAFSFFLVGLVFFLSIGLTRLLLSPLRS